MVSQSRSLVLKLACTGLVLLGATLVEGLILAQPAPDPPMGPPAPPPPPAPTTKIGSMGPDVYLDDLTYTLRLSYPRSVAVSNKDPNIAYVGSYDGYVWKTIDGGRTWDESRLVVEQWPVWGDAGEYLYFGRHRLSGRLSRELKEDEVQRRFDQKNAKRSAGRSTSTDEGGGGGGAGDMRGAAANVNFGIGVPGGAPRLQLLVRKYGKPTSGLNVKQTLLFYGTRNKEVRIIVIHPHDPKIVFACTMFGLYMTWDGGLNWVRTFMGTSIIGRATFHVAVDPNDGDKVFLATGEGLYISKDRGQNFIKTTKKGVGEGVIDWIYFNPHDSQYVFVGTDYGLLRSSDGGENWEWIYFTTFPDGRVVRSIIIDPFDKKTGYIATHDGMYTTPDILTGGLEAWQRLGGLKFTGIETSKIAACPKHKGHMWVLTNLKLYKTTLPGKWDSGGAYIYETVDGGTTWKIIYAGNTNGSMQWFESDPIDPDLLWLVWSRSLTRMRRKKIRDIIPTRLELPDDPPLGEVMLAAYHYTGSSPGWLLQYRKRSLYKALVPRLEALFVYRRWRDYDLLHDARYVLPFFQNSLWNQNHREFRVMLTWDLSDYIFNLNTIMFGRVDRITADLRGWVHREIQHFYGEFRRLRQRMAIKPPRDLRVRLMYKLRIQELASYLNFLTGNYLSRWWEGGRPSGVDTKIWEPWKLTKRITATSGVPGLRFDR